MSEIKRRLPIGAEVLPGGGTHFRVWAPQSSSVAVEIAGGVTSPLAADGDGYFAGAVPEAGNGTRYKYVLDSGKYPDPGSRRQPEGVHGPSEVVESTGFTWSDSAWRGVQREHQVIYEMHVGTFTHEGTWKAATAELPELARMGVTVVELMPVAEFAGRFGWGYDGVDLFAPTRLYGTPDEFRAFVDCAHACGLGVILDVVYNHLGPDGNYLREFSADYFSRTHVTEWGEALNFDGPNSVHVRDFVLANVTYWIQEFHLDGLRLDATQQLFDDSPDHIVAAIVRRAREAAGGRRVYMVGENEPQEVKLVRAPEKGGYDLDALWNDDLHHSAIVALTGRSEAYYTDYRGAPQEFISAAKWGYLYQGQRYKWQRKRRGSTALDVDACCFVNFLQNHDQLANTLRGERIHQLTSPGRFRAMTAFVLLAPGTPMLFQGQEFAASTPFLYFADHHPELSSLVAKGRGEFLRQFPSIAAAEANMSLPALHAEETFTRCKLDFSERRSRAETYQMHIDLLRLRREDPVLRHCRSRGVDGAVLGPEAFVLRYFGDEHGDRLLVLNLGRDLHLDPSPEPLLGPVAGTEWATLWSSENPAYGGGGTPPLDSDDNWRIPGHSAVVLEPRLPA